MPMKLLAVLVLTSLLVLCLLCRPQRRKPVLSCDADGNLTLNPPDPVLLARLEAARAKARQGGARTAYDPMVAEDNFHCAKWWGYTIREWLREDDAAKARMMTDWRARRPDAHFQTSDGGPSL